MKIFSSFFLLILMSINLFAQSETPPDGILVFEINKPQKIFINQTKIYHEPSIEGKAVDSLAANWAVQVLERDDVIMQLGTRTSNWYKISYLKSKKKKSGYIWGGNIAVASIIKGKYQVLLGINESEMRATDDYLATPQNTASIKVFENNKFIKDVVFNTVASKDMGSAKMTINSHQNLRNVDFIIEALFYSKGNVATTYEQQVLFLKNKDLVTLPQLRLVELPNFTRHESFRFPAEVGGLPNVIQLRSEGTDNDEDTGSDSSSSTVSHFIWDGYSLKKE